MTLSLETEDLHGTCVDTWRFLCAQITPSYWSSEVSRMKESDASGVHTRCNESVLESIHMLTMTQQKHADKDPTEEEINTVHNQNTRCRI